MVRARPWGHSIPFVTDGPSEHHPQPGFKSGWEAPSGGCLPSAPRIKCECRGCRGDRREGESGEQMVGVGRVPGPSVLGEADPRQLREQQVSLLCRAGQL